MRAKQFILPLCENEDAPIIIEGMAPKCPKEPSELPILLLANLSNIHKVPTMNIYWETSSVVIRLVHCPYISGTSQSPSH